MWIGGSKMTIQEAILVLETHNKWRRGAEIKQEDPKVLGEAIDLIIKYLKKCKYK